MNTRSVWNLRAVLALVLGTSLTSIAAAQSAASAEENKDESLKLEKFEVTGSRIKRTDIEGPSPITVISRADIEVTGYNNLTDVLRELPEGGSVGINEAGTITAVRGATGLNLRNLGTNNTLLLLDGRRAAPYSVNSGGTVFFNLGSIPLSAIERVEVLKDGASAIYGADATAGVVNVILRKDYTGLEVAVSYGNSTETDVGELNINIAGGAANAKASLIFGVDYFKRNPLAARDTPFAADAELAARYAGRNVDFAAVGAAALQPGGFYDRRSGTGPFATAILPTASQLAANGLSTTLINPLTGTVATRLPGTGGIAAGTLTTASVPLTGNIAAPTADQFIARQFNSGPISNLYNFQEFVWLTPRTDRRGTFARFTYDLGAGITAFADLSYQNNLSETQLAPSPISTAGDNNLLVPANNFYNPFGIPVAFTYRPIQAGPRIAIIDEEFYRIVGGLRGTIADNWDWEVGALYSYNQVIDTTRNSALSESRVRAALARTDSTALNIFGGPNFVNNAATIESIRVSSFRGGEAALGLLDAKVAGKLFEFWAGDVELALAAEYREEVFRENNDDISVRLDDIIGQVRLADPTDAYRNVYSFAAELNVPLIKSNTYEYAHAADLSIAGRFESFSDFGDSTKPKVGLTYQPLKQLLLRATYSEGFRAPTLAQLFGGIRESLPNGLADPSRPAALTGDPFDGSTTQRLVREGGNPNLQPEEAESFTYGLVWEPTWRFLKGLQVGVSYFDITQTDRIGNIGSNSFILSNEYQPGFEGFVVRNSGTETFTNTTASNINVLTPTGTVVVAPGQSRTVPGRISFLRNGVVNVAQRSVQGYDFDVRYTYRTNNFGRFTLASNLALVESIWNQARAGATGLELNGRVSAPNFRALNRISWDYKDWGVAVSNSYISSNGNLSIEGYEVDPYYYTGLQIRRSFSGGLLDRTVVSVGVDNILDQDPPLLTDSVAYDTSLVGRPQGRFFSIRLQKKY